MTVGKVQVIRPPDTTLSVNIDPSLLGTGYINLPYWLMFQTGVTNITASPPTFSNAPAVLTSANQAPVGYPAIYYLDNWDPVGGWIGARWAADAQTSIWHTIFQIPGDYVASTDLIVTFNEQCVVDSGGSAVATHSIDMYARRDTNANGKGVWGYTVGTWADYTLGVFNWNTDICLTAAQNTTVSLEWTQSMANTLSFAIDGDNANYPLTAGRYILLSFQSETNYTAVPDKSCRNIFANFRATYTRKIN